MMGSWQHRVAAAVLWYSKAQGVPPSREITWVAGRLGFRV